MTSTRAGGIDASAVEVTQGIKGFKIVSEAEEQAPAAAAEVASMV